MPKPNPGTFHTAPQGAAILKHGILKRYLKPYFSMTGSRSADHRGVYLDTHAGGGTYDDGTPGSAALAAMTAASLAPHRNVHCVYVDEDADMVKQLELALKAIDHSHEIIHGRIEEHLDDVLTKAGSAPLFAFIDPFGLALPFEDICRILDRAGKTELLLNVAIGGIRRVAGLRNPRALNRMMGGDWWKNEIWTPMAGDTRARDEELATRYRHRLGRGRLGGGFANWSIPVRDHPERAVSYYLVFLTRSQDGIWTFVEATSLAIAEYREWCFQKRGQMDLETDDQRDERYIAVIKDNIRAELQKGPLRIGGAVNEVYGDVLGEARQTHIRRAWDQLVAEGVARSRPRLARGVKIYQLTIEPA